MKLSGAALAFILSTTQVSNAFVVTPSLKNGHGGWMTPTASTHPTTAAKAGAGGGGRGVNGMRLNGKKRSRSSTSIGSTMDEIADASIASGPVSTLSAPPPAIDVSQIIEVVLSEGSAAVSSAMKTRDMAKSYLSQYEGQTGAGIVYTKLQDNGVEVVNGFSGGAILPVLDQFHENHPRHKNNPNKARIRWITNSNESSAGHVAEGYAKSNRMGPEGRMAPGVVVATSGPGVTNLITPLQDAMCDGVPIMVLCGQAATVAPPDAFQSAPAVQLTAPCTKWSYQVTSAAEIPWAMDYAFYVATTGRPGPVFIDLPKDIQTQQVTSDLIRDFIKAIPEGPASAMAAMGDHDDRIVRIVPHTRPASSSSSSSSTLSNGEEEYHAVHLGKASKGLSFEVVLSPKETDENRLKLRAVKDPASCGYHTDHHATNRIYPGTLTDKHVNAPLNGAASSSMPVINNNNSGQKLFGSDSELKQDMIHRILQAKRPIILAGQGCNDASSELLQFAEMLQIPVTTTLHGLGAFDERHDLALNMLGMHGHATPNFMVQESDLIINIGSRFDDRITGNIKSFIPEARSAAKDRGEGGVIHVDIRMTEMGKQVEPTFFVHSTGRDFLRAMLDAMSTEDLSQRSDSMKPWLQHMKALQNQFPVPIPTYRTETITGLNTAGSNDIATIQRTRISLQYVIAELNRQLLEADIIDNTLFSTGVGIHQMAAAQLITWTQPRQMLSSGSLGTMGVALGYSIGAQLANGQKIVIAIDGDGSFNMTFTELKTVAEQNIPVKILILDNEGQMMVEVWQKLFFDDRKIAVENEINPQYTKLAESFGIKSLYCDSKEALPELMHQFLFEDVGRPVLFHVKVPKTPCFPMVCPGKALDDMILGAEEDAGGRIDRSVAPS